MTIGPATVLGIIAATLATLLWWLINGRPAGLVPALAMWVYGVVLVIVLLAGPLIRLP